MSHSIALNLKRISLENELISLRQLHNFHSNRYKKVTSTLTATELAIHFGQGKSSVRQKLAANVVQTELN